MVLIVEARKLVPVAPEQEPRVSLKLTHKCVEILYWKPERKQALLHVVRADVDGKHVGAGQGSREHPGLGIHSTTQISLGSAITHYLNIMTRR